MKDDCADYEQFDRVGELLINKYKAYKHANASINDLVLRIEAVWLKTTLQMSLLRELSPESSQRLHTFQEECFRRLNEHLQVALTKFAHLCGQPLSTGIDVANLSIQTNTLQKIKYSLLEKQLRQLVSDLESWHAIFDPSWYLVARIQHDEVDLAVQKVAEGTVDGSVALIRRIRELTKTLPSKLTASNFIDHSFITGKNRNIPPTQLLLSVLRTNQQDVLLETTAYPDEADLRRTIKFVKALSTFLSTDEISSLSLLRCLGIIPRDGGKNGQFQYVFALPASSKSPVSLRTLLTDPAPSLDARFHLSKCLVKALTSLHAANFVHKNIRPETMIVIEDPTSGLLVPYLVGFENLRLSEAHSSLVSDMVWERNVYRHPSRQGLRPQEYYTMQHDIYSLGVCLLEIGIWATFITYDGDLKPSPAPTIAKLPDRGGARHAAGEIKNLFASMGKDQLPSKMGKTYAEVVVDCLTCLDNASSNPLSNSPDLLEEDGIAIGIAFIENILMRLEAISL